MKTISTSCHSPGRVTCEARYYVSCLAADLLVIATGARQELQAITGVDVVERGLWGNWNGAYVAYRFIFPEAHMAALKAAARARGWTVKH